MMTKLFLEMLCASLMFFVAYGDGQGDSEYLENSQEKTSCVKIRNIACACGIGDSKRILTLQQKIDPDNSKEDYNGCPVFANPYQLCANKNCVLAQNQSLDLPSSYHSIRMRNIVDSMYPQVFTISAGQDGHRYARQTYACYIPTPKNALINCRIWPDWQICDITCNYGYALSHQGNVKTSVNINCRNTEDIWKPHGFAECQPYLNCKAHLTKPGYLFCKNPFDSPAYCKISCEDDDQFDATPCQKYECVDENFGKSLPHCAALKDIAVVRRPNE